MTKFLKNKMRLDEYLVENEYFENLEIAKRQIMVGNILVNEQKIDKPGEVISLDKIKSIRIKEIGSIIESSNLSLALMVIYNLLNIITPPFNSILN